MIILVDKPKGITSFDVIRKLRNKIPNNKMWHGGTLDPMATWLLILWTDKDTTKLPKIQKWDKEYIATISFDKDTDTRDMEYHQYIQHYKIIDWQKIIKDWEKIKAPPQKDIQNELDNILGQTKLQVPYFSAKKKNGKKLYELARQSKMVELESQMHIYDYEILSYDFPQVKIQTTVWGGTYIRSIAYWLGHQFNLGGTLSQLRRMSIGQYKLEKKKNKENKIKIIEKI